MKRYDFIDSMRGFAVLAVLLVHTTQLFNNLPPKFASIAYQGARGVQLFYIISAFTLLLSLYNKIETEKHPYGNFFIRRFFRIAPLYWAAIVIYLLVDGTGPRYWLGDAQGITINNIVSNFLFTHGFNPYFINSIVPGGWSVGIEMTFYLIVPALFLAIRDVKKAAILTFVTFLTATILNSFLSGMDIISSRTLWNDYLFLWLPTQLPIFCLGVVLFFIIEKSSLIRLYSYCWRSL